MASNTVRAVISEDRLSTPVNEDLGLHLYLLNRSVQPLTVNKEMHGRLSVKN